MKIAHEAPLSIMKEVDGITDYSYALVHLFEEMPEYLDHFMQLSAQGREIILDNSLFELETPFDPERFCYWVEKLKPTWYIIPDKLEDKDYTVESIERWNQTYRKRCDAVGSKSIGVVQGRSYNEIVECYKSIAPMVDKIAISFDYSFFHKEWFISKETIFHAWMKGRNYLIFTLLVDKVIDHSKPHHLLGCSLPQEFKHYRYMKWIDSVDTSNPVVCGLKGIRYTERGLEDKPSQKLYTLITSEVTDEQLADIKHNINAFRSFVS